MKHGANIYLSVYLPLVTKYNLRLPMRFLLASYYSKINSKKSIRMSLKLRNITLKGVNYKQKLFIHFVLDLSLGFIKPVEYILKFNLKILTI